MTMIKELVTSREEQVENYINDVYLKVVQRDPHEKEFHQAVYEFFQSIKPTLEKKPTFIENNILERIVEPERFILFRVPWVDDDGNVQVNRGYRVQFNSAIGPYKGGIRFHPTVNSSIIKFLGFEQIFKNALTGQPIGGGKGGADFDPKGKSNGEIMRFCQSYMTELAKYIDPDTDVPAGDIGVGSREIGYLFGQYKRIKTSYQPGVITGKGLDYGGSLARTEATGYGVVYFVQEMLKAKQDDLVGKTVVVSGSGNVSIYAMEKAIALGAKVVACSDSEGYIYNKNGIDIETVKQLKLVDNKRICDYTLKHPNTVFSENSKEIWKIPCDIALPCATQNELDEQSATILVNNGVQLVAEGANMPVTPKAIDIFIKNKILFGPAKAVNAGGVAVSSLEMSQNSSRMSWTFEEVDLKLQAIMKRIYQSCIHAAEESNSHGNLVVGANVAGFTKIANAMIDQGVI